MDRISTLEEEILQLRKTLQIKEKELQELKKKWIPVSCFLHCYFKFCVFTSKATPRGQVKSPTMTLSCQKRLITFLEARLLAPICDFKKSLKCVFLTMSECRRDVSLIFMNIAKNTHTF